IAEARVPLLSLFPPAPPSSLHREVFDFLSVAYFKNKQRFRKEWRAAIQTDITPLLHAAN
ncbi:uncharacterized, partial [Tachysurus ichikawai]